MNKNTLSPRLMSVVSYIKKGSTVADIGTDHARIPIYILQNNISDFVIASDIVDGPLGKAAENLKYFNLTDKVSIRKASGLSGISDNEADCAVIAGMGGELISNILRAYIPRGIKQLIIQPMTDADKVRRALAETGFSIKIEDIVPEGDKMYIVIVCERGNMSLSEEEFYISPVLSAHPLFKEYLLYKLTRMKNAAAKAIRAGANTEMLHEYTILKKAYENVFK
ncbi:MAG: class I SAM-dependent methyltransferase [Bacillota bacterium]|nr:class I SAM-dependent methyltransferase [Bacillota bacterium]